MYLSGIDEAGRGPVLGPMVMAIVTVNISDLDVLKDLGITDSKLLSPKVREKLLEDINSIAKEIHVIKVDANKIDEKRKTESLNLIEAKMASELINKLETKPRRIYVDCPDVNTERYKDVVYSYLNNHQDLVVEHKADLNYVVVSASSIVAKVERDLQIKKLEQEYGIELGSGYPHDPKTKLFLENCVKSKDIPDFVRKSWQTFADAIEKNKQRKLM